MFLGQVMKHYDSLPMTMVDSPCRISAGDLGVFLTLKIEVLED